MTQKRVVAHDPYEDCWDMEEMTLLARAGSFPPGYLAVYGARQRARHAKLDREIRAAFAAAANDPELLERLNRHLS